MKKTTKQPTAISVKGISKTFRIPHEQISTLRGAFVNFYKRKTYEEFNAVDNVSFEVKKGEFLGIIGRNGSGKSTLLKILAGIYATDTGSIEINGRISPFLELGIGFNPDLSGRDNVYLNGAVLGLSKSEIDEKMQSILDFSEIERFIDQKIKNYSSGMQARLAFAVAIHANREILLMDEVLAVGDTNFQQKCLDEFIRYRELGKTVVLVSHDIDTIQKYCDRAVLLRNGKVQAIGLPRDVYELYINQNISDAENLVEKAELAAGEVVETEEKSRRFPKIQKLEIIDSFGEAIHLFKTNDDVIFRAIIDRQEYPNDEPINIGIGIYKEDGSYVLSYSTQMDKKTISGNTIDLHFQSLPLLKGRYTINVVCFGKEEGKYFDFKKDMESFQVFPTVETSRYRGAVSLPHTWSDK